jgi:cysteinyl-tRNA synthetase
LDRVFALLPSKKDMDLADELRPKIQEREQARKDRNFKRADEIRKELLEAGIVLEDTKDGVRWKILEKLG